MPYTERMAEAFLQAKEQQRQETQQQEPQGVPVQGTAPGVKAPVDWPKYRKPTKEEADQHLADTKSMLGFGATGLGIVVGGGAGGAAGAGLAKGFTDIFGPKLENHIRNPEWVPDYKHWDESDFQGMYWGI